jgi:PQQ-dependent catabolism-associated CXXCW motif protein
MKTASRSPARAAKTVARLSAQHCTLVQRRLRAVIGLVAGSTARALLAVAVIALVLPDASVRAGESAAPAPAEATGQPNGTANGHPDTVPAPGSEAKPSGPVAEPSGYRMEDFRTPVPATLRGALVLTNDEAADIWNKNGAVFIDVYPQAPKPPNLPAGTFWREPIHRSIEGAQWLPNVGYGALSASMDEYFRSRLEQISKGKRDAALVFFCLKDCWMSWNAAKRALEYGYTNVMWFRDGTDGWQELGYPLAEVPKLP